MVFLKPLDFKETAQSKKIFLITYLRFADYL